ncbi:hypothetical protein NW767_014169 [Fusarium falciforme]|nr:hypothetical protein NW767_014169 [Fusarium falciforme]
MFLWVRLMLGDNFNTDYLEGTKGDAEILATIDELPHLEEYGEESLDCIYETILSRPAVSQPQRRRRARRILRWLISATSERPFRADELVVAAELAPQVKGLDVPQTIDPRAVICLLPPLVYIAEDDSVSLIHLRFGSIYSKNRRPNMLTT